MAATLVLSACSGSGPDDRPEPVKKPLSILLVNDDGWNAPGITAVYDALREDGHDVTMVAPLENQSGASMSSKPEPGSPKYAVDGTPVDAVNVGLFGVLKGKRPDLVVSGANLGANVAANTNYSGTVGAASAASEAGFPALAVSADTGAGGEADFDDAADTVVSMVDALAEQGFEGLGLAGFLNVNVPAETDSRDAPRGVRSTPLGVGGPRTVSYEQSGPSTWTPVFEYDERVGAADADAQQLADGWTTVTWLTSARTFPASRRDQVDRLLETMSR
jgi:5'-nucleotidase